MFERVFKLKHNKTNVKTEILAGLTTFLTMLYIIPVNASIMSAAGMSFDALIAATAIVSALACIFTAFFANTPIAMSVGMGVNAYFAFSVCVAQNIAWQSALGAVFVSGLLFFLIAFTNLRIWIIKNIPSDLRTAICVGIGCFIAFLGLQQMGVIVKNEAVLVGIGDLSKPSVLFSIFTLILIMLFYSLKLKSAFILAVLCSSLIAWIFNIGGSSLPQSFFSMPNLSAEDGFFSVFLKLDIMSVLNLAFVPIIATFFITQLFDSIGTITGVGARAKLFDGESESEKKEGEKKLGKTLLSDATASSVCAFFGTSTVTSFVESSTGVEAGARTGLAALVVGICFILSLFLLPIFKAIPANAIYPVLVMVGILMFMEVRKINFKDHAIAVSAFFIIIMMPLTYSITTGFAFGFISYVLMKIFRKEAKDLSLGIWLISLIALMVFILQFLNKA